MKKIWALALGLSFLGGSPAFAARFDDGLTSSMMKAYIKTLQGSQKDAFVAKVRDAYGRNDLSPTQIFSTLKLNIDPSDSDAVSRLSDRTLPNRFRTDTSFDGTIQMFKTYPMGARLRPGNTEYETLHMVHHRIPVDTGDTSTQWGTIASVWREVHSVSDPDAPARWEFVEFVNSDLGRNLVARNAAAEPSAPEHGQ